MTTLERAREVAALEQALDDEGQVLCVGHRGTPPHPADWYARCPCGRHAPMPVCNRRREQARTADGWHCGGPSGCGTYHPHRHLEFWRI